MELKVMMMGGRRCGKTSVLASMFDAATHGIVKNYLTVADDTDNGQIKDGENIDSLNVKKAELIDFLDSYNTGKYLIDQSPTEKPWEYRLKIKRPGTDEDMFIHFWDVPGEYCRRGNDHSREVSEYVATCDVYVVVIDTPFLMEAANPDNKLCSEGINLLVNRVDDIQQFLTYINDDNGRDGKMVLFCPVKCEKWFNEGRINEVNNRIKEVYGTIITNLRGYEKIDISIIPALTAGNIEFAEHKEALALHDNPSLLKYKKIRDKWGTVKCCYVDDGQIRIRLADGTTHNKRHTDTVNEHPDGEIIGSKKARPFSWFVTRYNVDSKLNGYKPVNCEQVPLHIIRFMVKKYFKERSFWERTKEWFGQIFGKIDPKALERIIADMKKDGVIKDGVDGIEHIKQVY